MVSASCANSARAKKGEPVDRWQLRQWQMRTLIGSPSQAKRTAPQKQPPWWIMGHVLLQSPSRRSARLGEAPAFDFPDHVPAEAIKVAVDLGGAAARVGEGGPTEAAMCTDCNRGAAGHAAIVPPIVEPVHAPALGIAAVGRRGRGHRPDGLGSQDVRWPGVAVD